MTISDKHEPRYSSDKSHKASENELLEEKDKKIRIALCVYALLGLTLCQMSKMNLNVSIVEMVRNSNDRTNSSAPQTNKFDGSCPYQSRLGDMTDINQRNKSMKTTTTNLLNTRYFEVGDNNNKSIVLEKKCSTMPCKDDDGLIINKLITNRTISVQSPGDLIKSMAKFSSIEKMPKMKYRKFNWTSKQQNLLLGSFYISYAPLMILGIYRHRSKLNYNNERIWLIFLYYIN